MSIDIASFFLESLEPLLQFDIENNLLNSIISIQIHQYSRSASVLRYKNRLRLRKFNHASSVTEIGQWHNVCHK